MRHSTIKEALTLAVYALGFLVFVIGGTFAVYFAGFLAQ